MEINQWAIKSKQFIDYPANTKYYFPDDQIDSKPFDRQRKTFQIDRQADRLGDRPTKELGKTFMTSTGFTA